jgi:hypothetical protein
VVITHRGVPTRRERLLAAVRYGGDGAVITGLPGLQEYGVRAARTAARPHVLIRHASQRTSHSFVTVERTRRLPEPRTAGGLPLVGVARAVIDACRRCQDLNFVREIAAEVVQRGLCTPAEIGEELRAAARQRTALARAVVREIEEGVRSVAEALAKEELNRAGIPPAEWNVELLTLDGEFIASPDAYWRDVVAALQIDSMRFHLGPADYKRTQRRQRALTIHGVLVLPIAPSDVISDRDGFIADVVALRAQAAARPRPRIVVRRRPG